MAAKIAPTSSPRSVIVLPGLGNSSADYLPLASTLQARGLNVHIAPVSRLDWSRNAAGLLRKEYYTGKLTPRPTVDWYLDAVAKAIDQAKSSLNNNGGPITLVAHSAGGWLARVYLKDFDRTNIDRLVTLGSPHRPPPLDQPYLVDQTRGILTYVENEIPGCFHPDIEYITVAGRFLHGAPLFGDRKEGKGGRATWEERIAGVGYQQTCGSAEVWGDGIVPLPIAHLPGSIQINLEKCWHSPLASTMDDDDGNGEGGDGDDATSVLRGKRSWYGSKALLGQWVDAIDGNLASFKSSTLM